MQYQAALYHTSLYMYLKNYYRKPANLTILDEITNDTLQSNEGCTGGDLVQCLSMLLE